MNINQLIYISNESELRKKNSFVPATQKFEITDISKCVGENKIATKKSKSA